MIDSSTWCRCPSASFFSISTSDSKVYIVWFHRIRTMICRLILFNNPASKAIHLSLSLYTGNFIFVGSKRSQRPSMMHVFHPILCNFSILLVLSASFRAERCFSLSSTWILISRRSINWLLDSWKFNIWTRKNGWGSCDIPVQKQSDYFIRNGWTREKTYHWWMLDLQRRSTVQLMSFVCEIRLAHNVTLSTFNRYPSFSLGFAPTNIVWDEKKSRVSICMCSMAFLFSIDWSQKQLQNWKKGKKRKRCGEKQKRKNS